MSKSIVVLSTGGTIASRRGEDGRSQAGQLTGEELVSQLSLPSTMQVQVHSVLQKPSNALSLEDLLLLREQCLAFAAKPEVAGIVLTHGTDTLEDTAFFLQSSLPHDLCPVVVTGSQRPPHALGTDAYANLAAAIKVAASDQVHGAGVLVVFNESIFSANHVRKVNSFQLHGFDAPGFGHLGYIDGAKVTLFQRPHLPATLVPGTVLPRVDIVSVSLGAGPEQLAASVASGAVGVVLEAVGRGHVPPSWMPVIRELVEQGAVLALSTGCAQGPLAPAYDFPGCMQELRDAGVYLASDLSARKARLRLMLALSGAQSEQALQRLSLASE
ncbi:asparaginase [Alcaligenes endophyticus]|uniref:Asparaginase n=1 Tax=Alcaligenes endophyticus TaxID=1929088 RepID=A0ABT8EI71_9BURK|nr:asparaginase [Alcaligenes endophyticus]MCX5592662.1 asparaginase [Alcaligenes endophyticus]MDN4120990.1 asparaginase [Alcaligenes endophyticus]